MGLSGVRFPTLSLALPLLGRIFSGRANEIVRQTSPLRSLALSVSNQTGVTRLFEGGIGRFEGDSGRFEGLSCTAWHTMRDTSVMANKWYSISSNTHYTFPRWPAARHARHFCRPVCSVLLCEMGFWNSPLPSRSWKLAWRQQTL